MADIMREEGLQVGCISSQTRWGVFDPPIEANALKRVVDGRLPVQLHDR
jgi:hypothetical protein